MPVGWVGSGEQNSRRSFEGPQLGKTATRGRVIPGEEEVARGGPVTVIPSAQPSLQEGEERTYFNFPLRPPHDKGEISPNIIIFQKILCGVIKREIQ